MPFLRRLVAALAVLTVLFTLASRPNQTFAASCSGNSHAMTLSGGRATPGTGTTATNFTFSVTYTDNDACVPDRIVVVVVGVGTYALSYVSGGLQTGATFTRTMLLPAGRWAYRFEASSGSGAGHRNAKLTTVNPAKVVVSKPTAAPTPKPVVTPKPIVTPKPVSTPAPTPRRTATPTKPPSSPRASTSPTATAIAATAVPTAASAPPTGTPSPTRIVTPTPSSPAPGTPVALAKLLVSTIGTIGGLVLFAALYRQWLRPAPAAPFPPVARRRHDDPPAAEPTP